MIGKQQYLILNASNVADLTVQLNEASKQGYLPVGDITRGGAGLILMMRYQNTIQRVEC